MIISTVVVLLALINTADAELKAYNVMCISGTDTCAVGQTCKDAGASTLKCLCDTTNKWVENSGATGCVCDATNHWTANAAGTACECSTGYTGASCKANLGTACNTTADCDTATITTAVCDVLATPKVCKIKSTGDCTGKTDKCVSGAACTSNFCVCSTKYKENTDKLCPTVLGLTCTATADCTPAVANSDCTGTGTKTCTCNAGFTKQGADCSGATGVAACLAMILACIFTTIV